MNDVRAPKDRTPALAPGQRDALWKWRWLGLRESTPAFKACMVLLAAVAFALVAYTQVALP
jgi:hypothetical protein